MVGLIHTPRTLYAIGKGLLKRRSAGDACAVGGIGPENPYVSTGRPSAFDTDYLMHMNNAAYLSHAEYARWELCAYNGLLQAMYQNNVNFMVDSNMIRFRKEIAPIYKKFEVHSFLARMDHRSLWIYQAFRFPATEKDPGRIRAHSLCQGITVKDRKIIDPRIFLRDMVKMDPEIVEAMSSEDDLKDEQEIFANMIQQYGEMEAVMRAAAGMDDDRLTK